jgi:hypothetical protein
MYSNYVKSNNWRDSIKARISERPILEANPEDIFEDTK